MKRHTLALLITLLTLVSLGAVPDSVSAATFVHPFTNTTNLTFSNSIDTHTMSPGCDGGSPPSYTWSLTVNGVKISGTHICPVLDPGPTNLTVTPQSCSTGQNFLNWDDTPGAASYSIYLSDNTWLGNSLGSDFTHTGSVATSYTYYVRSNDGVGVQSANSATASGTTAAACPAPTVSLSATPLSIDAGDSSTLTWTVTNATTCTASGGWSGAKANTGGSEVVTPPAATTYNLSCSGPGGTTNAVPVTIVRPTGSISASPCTIVASGTSCNSVVTWNATNFIGTPEVAQGGVTFSSSAVGSESRTVTPDDRTFGLADTGGAFTTSVSATVSCDADAVWVSAISSCVPFPLVDVVADADLIRSGSTQDYEISIDSNLDLVCVVRDGGEPQEFSHTAAATTQVYSRTTRPLTSAQIIDVSCVSSFYPTVTGEDQMRIEVIPTIQEV